MSDKKNNKKDKNSGRSSKPKDDAYHFSDDDHQQMRESSQALEPMGRDINAFGDHNQESIIPHSEDDVIMDDFEHHNDVLSQHLPGQDDHEQFQQHDVEGEHVLQVVDDKSEYVGRHFPRERLEPNEIQRDRAASVIGEIHAQVPEPLSLIPYIRQEEIGRSLRLMTQQEYFLDNDRMKLASRCLWDLLKDKKLEHDWLALNFVVKSFLRRRRIASEPVDVFVGGIATLKELNSSEAQANFSYTELVKINRDVAQELYMSIHRVERSTWKYYLYDIDRMKEILYDNTPACELNAFGFIPPMINTASKDNKQFRVVGNRYNDPPHISEAQIKWLQVYANDQKHNPLHPTEGYKVGFKLRKLASIGLNCVTHCMVEVESVPKSNTAPLILTQPLHSLNRCWRQLKTFSNLGKQGDKLPYLIKFMTLMNHLAGLPLYTNHFMCAQLLALIEKDLTCAQILKNAYVNLPLPMERMCNIIYDGKFEWLLFKPVLVDTKSIKDDPCYAIGCILSLLGPVETVIAKCKLDAAIMDVTQSIFDANVAPVALPCANYQVVIVAEVIFKAPQSTQILNVNYEIIKMLKDPKDQGVRVIAIYGAFNNVRVLSRETMACIKNKKGLLQILSDQNPDQVHTVNLYYVARDLEGEGDELFLDTQRFHRLVAQLLRLAYNGTNSLLGYMMNSPADALLYLKAIYNGNESSQFRKYLINLVSQSGHQQQMPQITEPKVTYMSANMFYHRGKMWTYEALRQMYTNEMEDEPEVIGKSHNILVDALRDCTILLGHRIGQTQVNILALEYAINVVNHTRLQAAGGSCDMSDEHMLLKSKLDHIDVLRIEKDCLEASTTSLLQKVKICTDTLQDTLKTQRALEQHGGSVISKEERHSIAESVTESLRQFQTDYNLNEELVNLRMPAQSIQLAQELSGDVQRPIAGPLNQNELPTYKQRLASHFYKFQKMHELVSPPVNSGKLFAPENEAQKCLFGHQTIVDPAGNRDSDTSAIVRSPSDSRQSVFDDDGNSRMIEGPGGSVRHLAQYSSITEVDHDIIVMGHVAEIVDLHTNLRKSRVPSVMGNLSNLGSQRSTYIDARHPTHMVVGQNDNIDSRSNRSHQTDGSRSAMTIRQPNFIKKIPTSFHFDALLIRITGTGGILYNAKGRKNGIYFRLKPPYNICQCQPKPNNNYEWMAVRIDNALVSNVGEDRYAFLQYLLDLFRIVPKTAEQATEIALILGKQEYYNRIGQYNVDDTTDVLPVMPEPLQNPQEEEEKQPDLSNEVVIKKSPRKQN